MNLEDYIHHRSKTYIHIHRYSISHPIPALTQVQCSSKKILCILPHAVYCMCILYVHACEVHILVGIHAGIYKPAFPLTHHLCVNVAMITATYLCQDRLRSSWHSRRSVPSKCKR